MAVGSTSRRFDFSLFLLCAAISSAWCVTSSRALSATIDEPFYLRAGLDYWRTGSNAEMMSLGTMPLPAHVATLPVYLWEEHRGQPFDTWTDFDQILPVARTGTLLFWWLLLFYSWRIGNALAGPWAGRLALLLTASEPNLLAHASLATADIALTACFLIFLYHYRAGQGESWLRRVGLPGLLLGVALLAKVSALYFAAIGMTALELARQHRASQRSAGSFWSNLRLKSFVKDSFQIGGIALVVGFAYVGSDWQSEPSFVEWATSLPPGPVHDGAVWVAEHCRIFSNAGVALGKQFKHNIMGHCVYLLGETHTRALWYYFPLALTMKLTLPFLVLLGATLILRRRAYFHWVGVCVLALLVASLTCRVQIGIRLVFPLVVLSIIAASAALINLYQSLDSSMLRRRRLIGWLAVVAVTWQGTVSAHAWPDGLRHLNPAWGGSESGYQYLSDSNYDWGQGFNELADWQRDNEVAVLDVWYFGTDPKILLGPTRIVLIHEWPINTIEELAHRLSGCTLAVSTTTLHGGYVTQPNMQPILKALRERTPLARTSTYFIYSF